MGSIFTPTGMPKGYDQIDPRKDALTKALGGGNDLQTIADNSTEPIVRSVGGQTYLFEHGSYRQLAPNEVNDAVNYASSARGGRPGSAGYETQQPFGEGFYNSEGDYTAIGRPISAADRAANPFTGPVAATSPQPGARQQAAAGEVSGDYNYANPYSPSGGITGGVDLGSVASGLPSDARGPTTGIPNLAQKVATPLSATTSTAHGGVLPGWDATKWDDPTHNSVKYVAGRIFSNHAATNAGLDEAWPEILAAFPNASRIGSDKIDFGDGNGPIDVMISSGTGGTGWAWMPAGGGSAASTAGAGGAAAGAGTSSASSSLLPNLQDPTFAQQLLQMVMQALATNSALRR